MESVTSLMQQGASIHSKDRYGRTGLHWSALHGHDDIVKIFLSKGAEVNIRDNGQWTPLLLAADAGHLSSTRLLLDHQADMELCDSDGDTALIMAADAGHPDLVSELLSRGAREDATNNEGDTAIKSAEKFGHFDVISMFAAWHNSESRTEKLFQAAEEGKTRLVKGLLIAGADYTFKSALGDQAIHKAASNGHVDTVRVLIEAGVDINSTGKGGDTPLIKAAAMGQLITARFLLDSGAEINTRGDNGWTALHYATIRNHLSVVCELLDRNADKSIVTKYGNIALNTARQNNYKDIALVLDSADITAADDENSTKVLMTAIQNGNVNVVAQLLQRGAKIDVKGPVGETPFQIATRFPQVKKQEYEQELNGYKKTGHKPKDSLEHIIQKANVKSNEMAKLFLSQKLSNHDQENIVQRIRDISEHFKSKHFDVKILDRENKFYLNHSSSEENDETLLEACVSQGLIPEREVILEIMKKKVENEIQDSDESEYRVKEEIQSAVPSSVGLRKCLMSAEEKYPWSEVKLSKNIGLAAILLTFAVGFYLFDVYTDISFTYDMIDNYSKNFTEERIKCKPNFDGEFIQAVMDCQTNFNSSLCSDATSLIKRIAQDCFENNDRFRKKPDEWFTVGVVSGLHVGISIVIGLILWFFVEFTREYEAYFIVNLPIPIFTRLYKFICDIHLYKNEHNRKNIKEKEYQDKKKRIGDKISAYENVVNLSLIIESSVEASFQFFLQTTFILPTVVLAFTDPARGSGWTALNRLLTDIINRRFISIVMSFATFSFGFYKIR